MTLLERALDRDRLIVLDGLAGATALAWAWIVPMARDMYGPMSGPSAWMMTPVWDATHVARLFAMWTVMMIGMMLPSAAPTMLLYAALVRRTDAGAGAGPRLHVCRRLPRRVDDVCRRRGRASASPDESVDPLAHDGAVEPARVFGRPGARRPVSDHAIQARVPVGVPFSGVVRRDPLARRRWWCAAHGHHARRCTAWAAAGR